MKPLQDLWICIIMKPVVGYVRFVSCVADFSAVAACHFIFQMDTLLFGSGIAISYATRVQMSRRFRFMFNSGLLASIANIANDWWSSRTIVRWCLSCEGKLEPGTTVILRSLLIVDCVCLIYSLSSEMVAAWNYVDMIHSIRNSSNRIWSIWKNRPNIANETMSMITNRLSFFLSSPFFFFAWSEYILYLFWTGSAF